MGNFNWVHLSDLHLKQFESFDISNMREKLLKELENLKDVQYVFITGDIANQFEYGDAKEIVAEIKSATKVKDENVFWSVGNHDISRQYKSRNSIIESMRNNGKNRRTKKSFESIIADSENRHLLYDFEFEEYYKRYKEILGYDPEGKPHAFYERENLCIVNLNTCIASYNDNDAHHLQIIEPDLLKLFKEKYDKPVFVLGHHSIDFFSDDQKDQLYELFDGRADLYLCGHAHRLGYRLLPNTRMDVHEFICGGGNGDSFSAYSFIYGMYDSDTKSVQVVPYSYRDKGNKEWNIDYELHKKLTKGAVFYFKRLMSTEEKSVIFKDVRVESGLKQVYGQVYKAIEDNHIDKRVKRAVDAYGLENTCQKYTEYYASTCQIPEIIKYIKDSCMFKELADVIIDTNSKFPLYISGEIGTGKSSFLTLLYMLLKKRGNDIVPLYFDLHSFELQDRQVAIKRFEAETKLFEEIISSEKQKYVILIIDGLDDHNRLIGDIGINWVSRQIQALQDSQNKKIISLGLWGEENGICRLLKLEDLEPTYTIVLKRLNMFEKNDYIEKFVKTQLYDDSQIQSGISKIKECVEKWNLEKADFRIFCMLLDSESGMLEKSDTYTVFLKKYCLKELRYKEPELLKVSKEAFAYSESIHNKKNCKWEKSNAIIFRHREICSFLTSYYFVNVLKSEDREEKKQMLKKQFVFSKENNVHIKNLIISDKKEQLDLYQVVREALADKDTSFDMVAQFCYLLPRVFGEVAGEEIKTVLHGELNKVSQTLNEIAGNTYKDYDYVDKDKELILLLRTIVCSLAISGDYNPLYDFVRKILTDKRYRSLNKQFYIDYYANVSKDVSLRNISLAEADQESISTTLLQLRHQMLRAVKTGSFKNYSLFVLDVVTYFVIVQECISVDDSWLTEEQKKNSKELLQTLLSSDSLLARLKKVQGLCDYLWLLNMNAGRASSIGVLEKLYSLKTSKRSGWQSRGIKNGESIADHIYGAYLVGMMYLPEDTPDFSDTEYTEYNKEKILTMILLHDIGEAYTGDIAATKKTEQQERKEQQVARAIFMSGTYAEVANLEYYKEIWEEFIKNSSINAKLAHEIDKIENLVQLLIYEKSGEIIYDFKEWKEYLRNMIDTRLGASIYDFIESAFKWDGRERTQI